MKEKTKTLIKSINKGPQTADPFTLNATLFFVQSTDVDVFDWN